MEKTKREIAVIIDACYLIEKVGEKSYIPYMPLDVINGFGGDGSYSAHIDTEGVDTSIIEKTRDKKAKVIQDTAHVDSGMLSLYDKKYIQEALNEKMEDESIRIDWIEVEMPKHISVFDCSLVNKHGNIHLSHRNLNRNYIKIVDNGWEE